MNINLRLSELANELLHIYDRKNKFVEFEVDKDSFIIDGDGPLSSFIYEIAKKQAGKKATLALAKSAEDEDRNIVSSSTKIVEWHNTSDLQKDVSALHNLKNDVLKIIDQKGTNPMFLSLGAIEWTAKVDRNQSKTITSPLIIFPVRLVVTGGKLQPVTVDFIDREIDSVFFNPSFSLRFKKETGLSLPLPDNSDNIDVNSFNLNDYLETLDLYLQDNVRGGGQCVLKKNFVAVGKYNNSDLCMYYDIKNNLDKISSHENIKRIFSTEEISQNTNLKELNDDLLCVLPFDKSQLDIIKSAQKGDSFVVQGPPGSGKSQTIVNVISNFLNEGKKVLFVSQKIAALTEVYNKAPAQLQPFMLRMDYESESVNVSAQHVHTELKNALTSISPIKDVDKGQFDSARKQTRISFKKAASKLSEYIKKLYETPTPLGIPLYKVIDGSIHGKSIPLAYSRSPIAQIRYDDILTAAESLKSIAQNLARMEKAFQSVIKYSWYSYNKYSDTTFNIAKFAQIHFDTTKALIKILLENTNIHLDINTLSLNDLKCLSQNTFSKEELLKYNVQGCDPYIDYAKKIIEKYEKYQLCFDFYRTNMSKETTDTFLPFDLLLNDENLSFNDFETISNTTADLTLYDINDKTYASEHIDAYIKICKCYDEECLKFLPFLRAEVTEHLSELWPTLKKYTSGAKFRFFDFKAKSALKKLLTFKTSSKVTKEEALEALTHVNKSEEHSHDCRVLASIMKVPLYENIDDNGISLRKLESIAIAFHSYLDSNSSLSLPEYIENIKSDYNHVASACKIAGFKGYEKLNMPLLKKLLDNIPFWFEFKDLIKSENEKLSEKLTAYDDFYLYLNNLQSSKILYKKVEEKNLNEDSQKLFSLALETINEIKAICNDPKTLLSNALEKYLFFYSKQNFSNSCYTDNLNINVKTLASIIDTTTDENCIDCYTSFAKIYNSDSPLEIKNYLDEYIDADRTTCPFDQISTLFIKGFLRMYVDFSRQDDKDFDFMLSREHISKVLSSYNESYQETLKQNASLVGQQLCEFRDSFTKSYKDDVAFLETANKLKTCRGLFKKNSRAITNLKRCIMMSPSTVSQMLAKDQYENFDVVIFDEASQVAPEYAITSIYRAKQCIILGDEHQMPVIKHFVSSGDDENEDSFDYELAQYEKVNSLLDEIATREGAFPIKALRSHFRSKTESLIEFSADILKYYPNMITFPSTELSGSNLGLKDFLIPNEAGFCDKGINEKEALKTVELIKEHFSSFFNTQEHYLEKSVGVITFGVKQKDFIDALVLKDKSLSDMITQLKGYCIKNQLPFEKHYFVKTIETVQGQETDVVIMSLTYGRYKSGGKAVSSFTMLSRTGSGSSDLGKKIFNVAVTRAKECLKLVHSTTSAQITSSNLKYLSEFVGNCEKWSSAENNSISLITEKPNGNFEQDVYDFVCEIVGDSERVITNYGIRKFSIKVPIAVLDKTKTKALFGIWTEKTASERFDNVDYYIKYKKTLGNKGWNLYDLYIFDWLRNKEAEKKNLEKYIKANMEE